MRVGKISEAVLNRSVLKEIRNSGSDLTAGPYEGGDAAILRTGESTVISSSVSLDLDADPVIRTILAIHAAINNLAAAGAAGRAVILNLILTEDTGEAVLKKILRAAEQTAENLGVSIAGGHTTVSRSVRSEIIAVTGIGVPSDRESCSVAQCASSARSDSVAAHTKADWSAAKERCSEKSCNEKHSFDIVMTKSAGIAAAMLLASEREKILSGRFTGDIIETAKKFREDLSVVPEAEIAGADCETVRMHDISEGGVFGALWELAEAEGTGLEINLREIPIRQESVEICEFFNLNPYQIYSEGSLLVLTGRGDALTEELVNAGIPAKVIGRTTSGRDRILHNQGEIRYLDKPQQDEIYKLWRGKDC
ncbi:AIR synthase-related protein [Bilifractor sp. HCP3S3_D3]|uniref:AIR synthase-related protein n=1 Tax=Bilifractor sp. HCP3S3_D3 TaxID=3438907 RepID=UPI003F8AB19A